MGVKDLFELHIYTMGSRSYARKVPFCQAVSCTRYQPALCGFDRLTPRWFARRKQVAQIIDPDQKLFRENIVSRDECGSTLTACNAWEPLVLLFVQTQILITLWLFLCCALTDVMNLKNLQRIFPVDDSMVLIIDDRVDVWQTSKNLIKIEPCTAPSLMTMISQ
jgi:hypothetical protein